MLLCYFQFMIILNIYDFIYLSMFKLTYYHQYDLTQEYPRLSYAFSFAALRLLILFITKLFKLYGRFHWAQKEYEQRQKRREMAQNQYSPNNPLTQENLDNHKPDGSDLNESVVSSFSTSSKRNQKRGRAWTDIDQYKRSSSIKIVDQASNLKEINEDK